MRFGFLVVAAAAAGVLASVAMPSGFPQTASTAVQSFMGTCRVTDLSPVRAVYDHEQAEITAGHTPESLGFKPAPVSIPSFPAQQPYPVLANNSALRDGQNSNWQAPPARTPFPTRGLRPAIPAPTTA
ncbi:MAG TPA: hypothetical protein VMF67_07950 [Rhizomicrobium sp.]|nr:hypothetical protein [Rhizomicrobium sp.]